MRSFRFVGSLAALSCSLLTLLAGDVSAHPHRGEHVFLTQPDGAQIEVVVWGDEFYARAETPNGYTLIVDPATGYICYAIATGDGDLVSSGIVYDDVLGDAELAELGIEKGVTLSQARRDALANATRSRLAPNQGKITPQTVSPGTVKLNGAMPAIADPVPAGTITGLVVLVDFPDRKYTIASSEVDNAFNGTGTYGSTWHGSIRKWSEQISGGVTSVQHKVLGYYTAKYDVSHYNAPTAEWDYSTSDELYKEVYAYIDANVDLTPYAVNRKLPSLALIYAGDVIARGWAMALWPHGGCGGYYRTSEGVTIDKCFMSNLGTRTPIDLETFRHELGHSIFYWPDTYDYDDDSQSAGGFATETDMPCAPFRMWAGWITPTNVTANTGVYSLAANGASFLRYNNTQKANEYFVAEYAKRTTYRQPPDQGLLIWHIDENGDNSWQDMTATRHYAMSVEQADGRFDLEKNVRAGDGDLFHAGDKTRFDDTTTPNSNWWDGSKSGFKLCDIGGITTDTMTVNVGCVAAGGAAGTGGASSMGGTTAKGGTSSVGGTTAKGGTSSIGGTTAKGGTTSKGGTSSMGGTTAKGGSSSIGGGIATGGRSSAGGSGAIAGAASIGGALSVGGTNTGGGSSRGGGTGTMPANGGATTIASTTKANLAGAPASAGGALGSVGGAPATTTPVADDGGDDSDGCSCSVPARGNDNAGTWFATAIVALAFVARRRRHQSSK
ncbi:MAG: MYXO-CTERM sorting domain-containing protein [Polyangiaceae bacterium]